MLPISDQVCLMKSRNIEVVNIKLLTLALSRIKRLYILLDESHLYRRHGSVPGHVWFVANQVAYFKKVSVDIVLKANRENVSELYSIPRWKPSDVPVSDGPKKKPRKNDDYIFTCSGRIDPKSGGGK